MDFMLSRYSGSVGQLYIQEYSAFPDMQGTRLPAKPVECGFISKLGFAWCFLYYITRLRFFCYKVLFYPSLAPFLFSIVMQIMGDKNLEDSDIEPAPKLIEVVFQNCRGQVDHWIEPYIRISIERLRRTERPYLKCLLMQVVRNSHFNCWLL